MVPEITPVSERVVRAESAVTLHELDELFGFTPFGLG
jgi:hypothetical protein